jgi:hypothetical protein
MSFIASLLKYGAGASRGDWGGGVDPRLEAAGSVARRHLA